MISKIFTLLNKPKISKNERKWVTLYPNRQFPFFFSIATSFIIKVFYLTKWILSQAEDNIYQEL